MIIDGNQLEKEAMRQFHLGNKEEGFRIQEEYVSMFRSEYGNKDHCPCTKSCRYHGNCKECVAIHRAHREHVPNCMRSMLNEHFLELLKLTEKSLLIESCDMK